MIQCFVCQAALPDHARFCSHCGQVIRHIHVIDMEVLLSGQRSSYLGEPTKILPLHAPSQLSSIQSRAFNFRDIVQGEIFKLTHQRITWIVFSLLCLILVLPYAAILDDPDLKSVLNRSPLTFFYTQLGINFSILRTVLGIFLLIMTARIIGTEYRFGTIRVLLARGIGRLEFIVAKIVLAHLLAGLLLLGGLVLNVILCSVVVIKFTGSLHALTTLPRSFWSNVGLYILGIAISVSVTILLAATMTVVGRSLAFGSSAALAWFPADNLGVSFMDLGYQLTHNNFWRTITAYLLGPNLNVLPKMLAQNTMTSLGSAPLVPVDNRHVIIVVLVYACCFAGISLFLSKRDIKE